MEKRDNLNIHIVLVTILMALTTGLFFHIKNQDVNFCRRVFAGLIKGNQRVEKMIDWPDFKAVGIDAGEAYSVLPNDKERQDYRKAFIEKFSLGFRRAQGRLGAFKNWRIYDNRPEAIIVACDYRDKNRTILFTVSKDGRTRLSSIQWE